MEIIELVEVIDVIASSSYTFHLLLFIVSAMTLRAPPPCIIIR